MSIAKNIKKLREKYNLSQEELAAIAGVTDGAVSSWEKGNSIPRMGAIQKIADHFGITKSEIIEDDDEPVSKNTDNIQKIIPVGRSVEVPLYGSIAAGIPLEMIEIEEHIEIPEIIGDKFPGAFLLRVNGDSMNKVVPNGMYALIDPNGEIKNGDIAAVNVNGCEATLKRFYKLQNTIVLEPDSYNPEHSPQIYDCTKNECDEIRVIGKMVWFMAPFNMKY